MNRQAGFTIIEVMIVTMIIGVLAALVLPTIRLNTARVKVSEALLASGPCRNMVTELYASGGNPPFGGNWGCEVPTNASKYVDSVTTDDLGMITISLRGFSDLRIDFHDITLMPLDSTGNPPTGSGTSVRRWRCGSVVDETPTPVPAQFLPSTCRG